MIRYFKYLFLFLLLNTSLLLAQDGVRNAESSGMKGKIMIVPFEPKLYMSEIDMKVNEVTKWNFQQIRENFRHQLDNQLKIKLQSLGTVLSFYADSVKTWKDLMYAYKSTSLSFDLPEKPTQATVATPVPTKIKDGQVQVAIDNNKKFTNTKITDNELLPYLNKKYESEYFVFINELDLKNILDSYNMSNDSYDREVTVHYSILDKTGKTISAGAATAKFSSLENNPRKIVANCFAPIAAAITAKLDAILNPKPPKEAEKGKK
jgi:hypothetical protein